MTSRCKVKNGVPAAQRKRIIVRARGLCEKCYRRDWRMAIDHIKNRGMGGTTHVYTDEELQYLCGECHDAKTENREVGLRER